MSNDKINTPTSDDEKKEEQQNKSILPTNIDVDRLREQIESEKEENQKVQQKTINKEKLREQIDRRKDAISKIYGHKAVIGADIGSTFLEQYANHLLEGKSNKILSTLMSSKSPLASNIAKNIITSDNSLISKIGGTIVSEGGIFQGGIKGIGTASKISKLQQQRQYEKELGAWGKAYQGAQTASLAMRGLYTANLVKNLALGSMGGVIGGATGALTNGATGALTGALGGAHSAVGLMGTGAIHGVQSTILGGGSHTALPQFLPGLRGAGFAGMSPLALGLIGTQIVSSIAKSAKLSKLKTLKKSPESAEKKHSLSKYIDPYYKLGIAQNQLMMPDQLQYQLLSFIESHTSVLPSIYSEISTSEEDKIKGTKRAALSYKERTEPSKKSILNTITDQVSLLFAKYDPSVQLLNAIVGKISPREFIAQIKGERKTDLTKKEIKKASKVLNISESAIRLLSTKSSNLISSVQTHDEKMLMLTSGIYDINRLIGQEILNIRKQGFGILSSDFQAIDKKKTLSEKIGNIITNIPGIGAIANFVHDTSTLMSKIGKGAGSILSKIPEFILGKEFTRLITNREELDKKIGIYKSTKEKSTDFIAEGLPSLLEKIRSTAVSQLEVQSNIFSVVRDQYSLLYKVYTGKDKKVDYIESLKTEKEERIWDYAEKLMLSTEKEKEALQIREDKRTAELEKNFSKLTTLTATVINQIKVWQGKEEKKTKQDIIKSVTNAVENLPYIIKQNRQFGTSAREEQKAREILYLNKSQQNLSQFSLEAEREKQKQNSFAQKAKDSVVNALNNFLLLTSAVITGGLSLTTGSILGMGALTHMFRKSTRDQEINKLRDRQFAINKSEAQLTPKIINPEITPQENISKITTTSPKTVGSQISPQKKLNEKENPIISRIDVIISKLSEIIKKISNINISSSQKIELPITNHADNYISNVIPIKNIKEEKEEQFEEMKMTGTYGPEIPIISSAGTSDDIKNIKKEKKEQLKLNLEKQDTSYLQSINENIIKLTEQTTIDNKKKKHGGIISSLFGTVIDGVKSIFSKTGGLIMAGLGAAAGGVGSIFGNVISSVLSSAGGWIAGAVESVGGASALAIPAILIAGAVRSIIDFISGWDETKGGILSKVWGGLEHFFLGSKEGGLGSAASGAAKYAMMGFAAGSFIPVIGNITGMLIGGAIGAIIDGLGQDRLASIGSWIKKWIGGKVLIDAIWKDKSSYAHKFGSMGANVPGYVVALTGGIIGSVIDNVISVFKFISKGFHKIKKFLSNAKRVYLRSVAKFVSHIPFVGDWVAKKIDPNYKKPFSEIVKEREIQVTETTMYAKAAPAVREAKEKAIEKAKEAKKKATKAVKTVYSKATPVVKEAKEKATETVKDTKEKAIEKAKEAKKKATEAVKTVYSKAALAVKEVKEKATEKAKEAKKKATEAVKTVYSKATPAVKEAKEKATETVKEVKEKATEVVKTVYSKAVPVIKNIKEKAVKVIETVRTAPIIKEKTINPIKQFRSRYFINNTRATLPNEYNRTVLPNRYNLNKDAEEPSSTSGENISKVPINVPINKLVTKKSLDGVQPFLQNRLGRSILEYQAIIHSNKPIPINSAYRSITDQAKLYKKYGPGHAALPGRSMHNYGLAVDIPSSILNKMDDYGILQQNGLYRPFKRKEPWHLEPIGIDRQKIKRTGKIEFKSGVNITDINDKLISKKRKYPVNDLIAYKNSIKQKNDNIVPIVNEKIVKTKEEPLVEKKTPIINQPINNISIGNGNNDNNDQKQEQSFKIDPLLDTIIDKLFNSSMNEFKSHITSSTFNNFLMTI